MHLLVLGTDYKFERQTTEPWSCLQTGPCVLPYSKQEPEDSDIEDSITNMVRSSTLSQVELCKIRGSGASQSSAELHNDMTSSSSPGPPDPSHDIYCSTGYYSLDRMKGKADSSGEKASLGNILAAVFHIQWCPCCIH